ncbi:MAG: alanine--tRNA ligase [Candidatus Korobacteraceae bacterium]
MFLRYFEQHGHKIVHSSSLVPANDPTLLFTNAGMNQFKDVFLGIEKRDYNKATSSQKCVRAGGKHNDLENVGFTNRHHTFFEMLGNFSFGDYFKKDAIAFAWELVTSPDWFGIPKDKLFATIFKGEQGIARDDEAYEHWRAVLEKDGVPPERIYEFGMKDNFWMMGDTGPCGPCSEIYYDMGPEASDDGHTDCAFGCECGRYVEIWNLVFMQFDKQPDGTMRPLPKPSIDTGAGLERVTAVMQGVISNYDTDLFVPLIQRAAELTGASLDIELKKEDEEERHHQAASLRVIADHARASTFLISDGVLPSNEGRGYVLRKIIRRAIRHGRLLGQDKPFLFEMVFALRDLMKDAYPELVETASRVAETIKGEETRFARTLNVGLTLLEVGINEVIILNAAKALDAQLQIIVPELQRLAHSGTAFDNSVVPLIGQWEEIHRQLGQRLELLMKAYDSVRDRSQTNLRIQQKELIAPGFQKLREMIEGSSAAVTSTEKSLAQFLPNETPATIAKSLHELRRVSTLTLPGEMAFKLYDTEGLPRDFMEDVCRDVGIKFDAVGFDVAMEAQRERARASWKGGAKATASPLYTSLPRTEFEGYHKTLSTGCEVLAIIKPHDGTGVGAQELKPGERGEIVLDHTPFYADAGGQVGDVGWLYGEDHNTIVAEVEGVTYPVQGVRAHRVIAKQPIHVGDKVDAMVNDEVRRATMRNHTGTHLLHAALRNVLGAHVKQAGSLVDPEHLRFDFSHFASVDDKELQDIEDLANKEVLRNDRVEVIEDVPIDVAVNEYHAMALFGEKYGDRVRVIRIGDFSTELCGGTHTAATGEIGLIKVLKEGSVSSGVRRLEAVTGEGSLRHFRKDHQLENVVSTLVRGGDDQSPAEALKQELERREDELKKLRKELDQARMKSASSSVSSAAENVREVKGVKVLATRADNLERPQLRTLIDNLSNKLGSGVVVLGSVADGKVAINVGVTKDLTSRVQAGKIIAEVAKKVGGSGGGRPDMAEAGGKDPAALDAALAESYGVVERLLS